MGFARVVVIDGPDLGCEFDIPMRGGGIGREAGNVVQLSDPSVSRSHCTLELHDGRLALVDHGSRNRSLVNGQPITKHTLEAGDEITVGKTRLSFLPKEGGVAVVRTPKPSRVTMEVASRELLQATLGINSAETPTDRARRHLAAVAQLGEVIRVTQDRSTLLQATCHAAANALAAHRTFILSPDSSGRLAPVAVSAPKPHESRQLSLPQDVVNTALADGKTLAVDVGHTHGVLAPLATAGVQPTSLLYAERTDHPWDHLGVLTASCLAHLVGAAISGFDLRAQLLQQNRDLEDKLGTTDFVGDSPGAQAVMAFVHKVGPSNATVLLTGESGSGKEMVARAVHRASTRGNGPFIAVNCAAMTETLVESELFGHEKGAFTGATERKLGRFEMANRGTLFLDEVGELSLSCQTKFLRVLEEQVFERVGGTRSIQVDVRVVAATNRDLPRMVHAGQFREDLYYRLSVIHTIVPPLRERPEDIPVLAEYFLARFRSQVPRRIAGFTPQTIRALMAHPWPGNVRELRNAVERAIVLGDGEWIQPSDLPPSPAPMSPQPSWMPRPVATPPPIVAGQPATSHNEQSPRSLRELERAGIVAALTATGGNKAQAASILEIDRSTLYKKIKDYAIEL